MEEVNNHKPENIGDSKYNRQAAVWLGVVAVLAVVLIVIAVNAIGSLSFGGDEKRTETEVKASSEPDDPADDPAEEEEPEADDDMEVVDTIPFLKESASKADAGTTYEKDATIGEIGVSSRKAAKDVDDVVDDAVAAAEKAVEEAKRALEEAGLDADYVIEAPDVPSAKSGSRKSSQYDIPSLDELERQSHAEAVKRAKEAGVSTKGSTLDILERISHAEAVKQAKEAGVSTKGSTLDILERISHAEAVKQAKEAGVSTKGSTLDILERISRKELQEMGY